MSANNWTTCPKCKKEDVLREDYEIGIWEGEFEASYRGECSSCKFLYKYKYGENLEISGSQRKLI